jgi:N6-L-threonylcarbamoyladenine synthase
MHLGKRAINAQMTIVPRSKYYMGIESSCDDTGVSIIAVEEEPSGSSCPTGKVLSNIVCSQADIHAPFGGVVPKLAQEAHQKSIDHAVTKALGDAKIEYKDLTAVGVTIGPGLSLCLRVGVTKARDICEKYDVKMIKVHHMEAHALVARLADEVPFPFLCLLVSGGHNLLLVVEGIGRFVQLGTTLDDALGECYDKTARALHVEAVPSGGAALEALALEGDERAYTFPVPLKKRKTCDFSFAGLKTSVRLTVEREREKIEGADISRQTKADIAASFQRTAAVHLDERVRRGFEWARETHPEVKHLVLAGGVAANKYLRGRLNEACEDNDATLVCPPVHLCTDNGAMVAWCAIERDTAGLPIRPDPDLLNKPDDWLDLRPRWPLTERKDERAFLAQRSAKKKGLHTSLELLTSAE